MGSHWAIKLLLGPAVRPTNNEMRFVTQRRRHGPQRSQGATSEHAQAATTHGRSNPITSLRLAETCPPQMSLCQTYEPSLHLLGNTPGRLCRPLRLHPALGSAASSEPLPPQASTGADGPAPTEDTPSGPGQAPGDVTQGIRAAPSPQGSGPLQRNPHPRQPATPPRDSISMPVTTLPLTHSH